MTRPSARGKTCVFKVRFPEMSLLPYRASKLDIDHRIGLRPCSGRSHLMDKMRLDGPVYDNQYRVHHLRIAGEQKPQLEADAQHPLAHRKPCRSGPMAVKQFSAQPRCLRGSHEMPPRHPRAGVSPPSQVHQVRRYVRLEWQHADQWNYRCSYPGR